jgi:hypothetical protein
MAWAFSVFPGGREKGGRERRQSTIFIYEYILLLSQRKSYMEKKRVVIQLKPRQPVEWAELHRRGLVSVNSNNKLVSDFSRESNQ